MESFFVGQIRILLNGVLIQGSDNLLIKHAEYLKQG